MHWVPDPAGVPGQHRARVLVLADYYAPGFLAGGPIRSLQNLVDRLGDEIEFRIVTRDRDLGGDAPYPSVRVDEWQRVGKAEVYYASPAGLLDPGLTRLLNRERYDVLYLNSFFSPRFSLRPLLLRRLGLIPRVPTVVAPRGEFSVGSLGLKAGKKRACLVAAKAASLCDGVIWQASTEHEADDIARQFARRAATPHVLIAPNIAVAPDIAIVPPGGGGGTAKHPGMLRIAFVSRIHRKKNLAGALRMLEGVAGAVEFNVYGAAEDKEYLRECEELAARLGPGVRVTFHGPLEHSRVSAILEQHHLFFLPTLGENFGHAILEALAAGCPVLISDQTAWRGLEPVEAGWDLPLEDTAAFRVVLARCVAMGSEEHRRWSAGARALARRFVEDDSLVEQSRALFLTAARTAEEIRS